MTIKPPKRYLTRSIPVTLAILAVMVLLAATAMAAPDYLAGDVNGDDVIDVRDVTMVVKHTLGLQYPPLTEVQLLAADINGDGVINVSDAVEIMKVALGLTDSFPMPIISLNDAVVRVPIGTALADINLPTTVEANFAGGQKRNISVRWVRVSTPAYNPFVFDEYIFKGDLINLPQGVRNPAELKATARVSFLLRDPWPFPDEGYSLTVRLNPPGGGTVFGAGNYAAGIPVSLTATPNTGYSFVSWTKDGTVLSTNRTFTYNMPASNVILDANFTGGEWPPELEEPPVVVFDDFSNAYVVTLTIKDQFIASVQSISVRGVPATQRPNPKYWRVLFAETIDQDDLIGQILINQAPIGSIDVINRTASSALYDSLLGGTWVRVQIQQGKSANQVMVGGTILDDDAYDALNNRWDSFIFGFTPGSTITVVATNQLGMQTVLMTVLPDPVQ